MTSPTDPTRPDDALPSTGDDATATSPDAATEAPTDATAADTTSTLENGLTETGDTARDTSKNSIGNIR